MKTIKFLSARKSTTIMSIILIVVSAFSLMTKGLNLGIDFKGGTAIGLSFSEDVTIQEVRTSLRNINIDGDELRDLFQNKDYSRKGREANIRLGMSIAAYLINKNCF